MQVHKKGRTQLAARAAAPMPLVRATAPVGDTPANHPPGDGLVLTPPGAVIQASTSPGAGLEGAIAKQSLAALKAAGGMSFVYDSPFNGNREVAVYAPPHFDPSKPYQVLVYNRGILGGTAQTLNEQFMGTALDQLDAGGTRNVLLVMPKSPTNMHVWFAGKNDDESKMLDEALGKFGTASGLALPAPAERWLMAHSGGGQSVANAYSGPNPPQFDKVLLADSSYVDWAGRFVKALAKLPGPLPEIAAVVTGGDTARHAKEQLSSVGISVNVMPPFNPNSPDVRKRVQHPDHMGVPSYMVGAFLPLVPDTLPYSHSLGDGRWISDAPAPAALWRPRSATKTHLATSESSARKRGAHQVHRPEPRHVLVARSAPLHVGAES